MRFPATKDLRPTPDRVRETLFNWLTTSTPGSDCLDLFAGSGALGFEAISRGANSVVFVDSSYKVTQSLKQNVQTLQLINTNIYKQDCIDYLKHCKTQFDIIFLDPPYASNLIFQAIKIIEHKQLIKTDGWIYLEFSTNQKQFDLPENWHTTRTTKAGEVQASLLRLSG